MGETGEVKSQVELTERQEFLLKTPELAKRITAFLQELDWVQEGNVQPRLEWQKELEEALKRKGGVAVILVDRCGKSCGQENRQFPEVMQETRKAIDKVLQGKEIEGGVTWGRRQLVYGEHTNEANGKREKHKNSEKYKHRSWEVGEDELWVRLSGVDEEKLGEIGKRLDAELNGASQRAYIALALVPQGMTAGASQLLRASDWALGVAKKWWKKRGERALVVARFGGGQWQLNTGSGWQEIPAAAMALKPAKYPEGVIITNAAQKLRSRWQDLGWQREYALIAAASPAEMKEINKKRGMIGGDQALLAIAGALVEMTEELSLKMGKIGIYKIGVNFVVTGPRALAGEIQEAMEQKLAGLPRKKFPFGIQYAFFGEELAE